MVLGSFSKESMMPLLISTVCPAVGSDHQRNAELAETDLYKIVYIIVYFAIKCSNRQDDSMLYTEKNTKRKNQTALYT